jgi:hypothetical protein
MTWQNFEKSAEEFINKNVQIKNVSIKLSGGSNSNATDLEVKKNNKVIFNIEIKEQKSQISQFVVINEKSKKKFFLGDLKGLAVKKTKEILEHMNQNYEYYKNPMQRGGINLICEKSMMYRCVENYLIEKKNPFIISSLDKKEFTVISTEKFKDNFSITNCKYRSKPSGTNTLAIKYYDQVKKLFSNKFKDSNIYEKKIRNKSRLYINLKEDDLNGVKTESQRTFDFENMNLFFSLTDKNNKFEIKKKSITNNPTVIFSIEFHNNAKHNDISVLIERIKKF